MDPFLPTCGINSLTSFLNHTLEGIRFFVGHAAKRGVERLLPFSGGKITQLMNKVRYLLECRR